MKPLNKFVFPTTNHSPIVVDNNYHTDCISISQGDYGEILINKKEYNKFVLNLTWLNKTYTESK